MGIPIVILGKGFIDAVIKILVVREDDMTTHIVQLNEWRGSVRIIAPRTAI